MVQDLEQILGHVKKGAETLDEDCLRRFMWGDYINPDDPQRPYAEVPLTRARSHTRALAGARRHSHARAQVMNADLIQPVVERLLEDYNQQQKNASTRARVSVRPSGRVRVCVRV